MIVETTLNLDTIVKLRLAGASKATGRERSWIITAAMKHLAKQSRSLFRDDGCVRYQERGEGTSWRRVHLSLDRRDYDLFLDMRKLFRGSVSLLVSVAVERYLDTIVERVLNGEFNEDTDNYPFQCYAIVQESIDNAIVWKIYWGLPANPARILAPTP